MIFGLLLTSALWAWSLLLLSLHQAPSCRTNAAIDTGKHEEHSERNFPYYSSQIRVLGCVYEARICTSSCHCCRMHCNFKSSIVYHITPCSPLCEPMFRCNMSLPSSGLMSKPSKKSILCHVYAMQESWSQRNL
jgi:hypothetical protein